MLGVNFSVMKKPAPIFLCVLLIVLALHSIVDAQVSPTTKCALQIDLGTPYQWAQHENRSYGQRPLRFSTEFLYHLHTNHRWVLCVDVDYMRHKSGYARFPFQGINYLTFVRLQHFGLYAGMRATLIRFPWRFDNGIFFEPQVGAAYESAKEDTPNVQLLPRPSFVRLDWRLRLGIVFPLSNRFQLSPCLELFRIYSPPRNDLLPFLIVELNLGYKF